ncbi:MAG: efflux RND transporter periplasmic adaptor subunit [Bacteroidales bacterium]|nr:efflux RND transporter periplasmic adaptor subunit [Bacteroidales bacterium]
MATERTQRINTIIALAVLGIVIATVCVIGSITYGKTNEIMQGQMEVSEYRVSSKIPGRIMEFRVKEGDRVMAGDTLAIIEAPEVMAKKTQAEAVKTAAVALNDKAEAGAREEQIQGAYELWQKAIVNRDIWEKSFKRVSNLYKEGVLSEQKYDETKAQYDAAVATEKAAKSQYDMAVKGAQKQDKEMAAAKVEQAKGVVEEVDSYIHETILLAYADGEVTDIFPHIGELVGTGAPIMNIAMMDDMWATFNVREDHLRRLPIGSYFTAEIPALGAAVVMEVNYMKDRGDYAAWKATKQTGQYDLKTFEVRAVPMAKIEGLRPGMTVIYRVGEEKK